MKVKSICERIHTSSFLLFTKLDVNYYFGSVSNHFHGHLCGLRDLCECRLILSVGCYGFCDFCVGRRLDYVTNHWPLPTCGVNAKVVQNVNGGLAWRGIQCNVKTRLIHL